MRFIGLSVATLTGAFLLVSLVSGQQFQGKGKGGGGFGGGQANQDAYTLLRNEQVKKELGVTDEQIEKIPAAVLKALSGVLDAKQMTRLRQIELQQRGTNAFLDPTVQQELKITPDQTGSIKTILDDSKKEMAEIRKEGFGGGFQEKMTSLRKETTEKVEGVLTADQRKAYKQMLGEEFKLQFKGFGGGGGGKGGKNKKKNDV